jgi:hypothetical protein
LRKRLHTMIKIAKQQSPVYFVSEVLTESKKFYSEMKKFVTQSS